MNHVVNSSVPVISCPNDATGIVAFERHDHEVAHRGRLQERPLMDAGSSSGLDELLVARAVQLVHQGAPFGVFPGRIGNATAINGMGTSTGTCVPGDGGSDSPLAPRDGLGDRMGTPRGKEPQLPCLPPMARVCARPAQMDRTSLT